MVLEVRVMIMVAYCMIIWMDQIGNNSPGTLIFISEYYSCFISKRDSVLDYCKCWNSDKVIQHCYMSLSRAWCYSDDYLHMVVH